MEDTRTTPRQELIRLRVAAGLSQKVMAQIIGIARNALQNAEEGRRIDLRTAERIAVHWGRPLAELFPEAEGRLTLRWVPCHRSGVTA